MLTVTWQTSSSPLGETEMQISKMVIARLKFTIVSSYLVGACYLLAGRLPHFLTISKHLTPPPPSMEPSVFEGVTSSSRHLRPQTHSGSSLACILIDVTSCKGVMVGACPSLIKSHPPPPSLEIASQIENCLFTTKSVRMHQKQSQRVKN